MTFSHALWHLIPSTAFNEGKGRTLGIWCLRKVTKSREVAMMRPRTPKENVTHSTFFWVSSGALNPSVGKSSHLPHLCPFLTWQWVCEKFTVSSLTQHTGLNLWLKNFFLRSFLGKLGARSSDLHLTGFKFWPGPASSFIYSLPSKTKYHVLIHYYPRRVSQMVPCKVWVFLFCLSICLFVCLAVSYKYALDLFYLT